MLELSPRQRQILPLMLAGKSANQMAADLLVSPTTIKTHVRYLYKKLGVEGRTDAILAACEMGLAAGTSTARIRALLEELADVRDEAPNRSRYAELYDRVQLILDTTPKVGT